uniref:Uncharacterized protein n=2 Tax=Chenopodium quinoa TaxID=63459 RepID=A0A803KYL8_CHEQI
MVIELQGEFGNKWAKIATYLAGRTDNDVKNFWSSRQKRLARLLHSQSPTRPNKKHKSSASSSKDRPHFREVSKNSSMEGESSSKAQSLNSSSNSSTGKKTMELIPFPGSVNHSCPCFEAKSATYLDPIPLNTYCNHTDLQLLEMPSFPSIPLPPFQTDFPFLPETQELIDRLDYSFFAPFGYINEPALINDGVHFFSCFGGGGVSGETRVKREDNHVAPDSFFDDFASDVFDEIEPLPSPPRW